MQNPSHSPAPSIAGYDYSSTAISAGSFTLTETALDLGATGTGAGAGGDDSVAAITYSDDAIAQLVFMIEEEKLAGDVYDLFYELYGLEIFANIAESEDRHFDALIRQAENLGLDVSDYLTEEAGTFVDEDLQALYDALIAEGSTSVDAALEVGVLIEEKDMVDIADAIEDVEDTALADVYQSLLDGSANHLDAFEFLLA